MHGRTLVIGSLLATLALAPAAHAAKARGTDRSLEAVAQLRPVAGQAATGLARLSARPGGRTRGIIAVLIAAVHKPEVVLSKQTCRGLLADFADGTSNTIPLGSLAPGAGGAALLEPEGILYAQLRAARSVAVVGDPGDGDGADDILACGELTKVRGRRGGVRGMVLTARQTRGVATTLVTGLLRRGRPGRLELVHGTDDRIGEYSVVASPRSCSSLRGGQLVRGREIGRFRTDEQGTARTVIELKDVLISSLRRARSLAFTLPFDRTRAVACAPVEISLV